MDKTDTKESDEIEDLVAQVSRNTNSTDHSTFPHPTEISRELTTDRPRPQKNTRSKFTTEQAVKRVASPTIANAPLTQLLVLTPEQAYEYLFTLQQLSDDELETHRKEEFITLDRQYLSELDKQRIFTWEKHRRHYQ